MQPVSAESLEAYYTQAITLGEELLGLLKGPASAAASDRVTELLTERGRIVDLTGALAATVVPTPDALLLLRRIVEQQPAIEVAFQAALHGLQGERVAAVSQRGKLQGAQSLLRMGPQSRLLNEYR